MVKVSTEPAVSQCRRHVAEPRHHPLLSGLIPVNGPGLTEFVQGRIRVGDEARIGEVEVEGDQLASGSSMADTSHSMGFRPSG